MVENRRPVRIFLVVRSLVIGASDNLADNLASCLICMERILVLANCWVFNYSLLHFISPVTNDL